MTQTPFLPVSILFVEPGIKAKLMGMCKKLVCSTNAVRPLFLCHGTYTKYTI